MALRLWNYYTNQYETVAAITDLNVTSFYPANKIMENYYATLRDQGERPDQAFAAICRAITYSD